MNSRYALDKPNAKLLGVCAGLARSTGWDPTLIRFGAVSLTLFLLGRSRSCSISSPAGSPRAAEAVLRPIPFRRQARAPDRARVSLRPESAGR